MPIYALIITMFFPSFEQSFFQENTLYWMNPSHKFAVLAMFFIFSFLAPAITLLMLLKTKTISTIEIDNQNERSIPLAISAIYCLVLALFLTFKAPDNILPASIYALPWGGFFGISIAGFINRYTKISLHGIGVGMFVGYLIAYFHLQIEFYFEIIIFAILISGLVMSARLILKKHTLKQVFLGFLLGFLSVFTCVSIFNIYYL